MCVLNNYGCACVLAVGWWVGGGGERKGEGRDVHIFVVCIYIHVYESDNDIEMREIKDRNLPILLTPWYSNTPQPFAFALSKRLDLRLSATDSHA